MGRQTFPPGKVEEKAPCSRKHAEEPPSRAAKTLYMQAAKRAAVEHFFGA